MRSYWSKFALNITAIDIVTPLLFCNNLTYTIFLYCFQGLMFSNIITIMAKFNSDQYVILNEKYVVT